MKKTLVEVIWAASVILVFNSVNIAAAAGATNFCRLTTEKALRSCQREAQSDHWLALGKCDNISDAAERKACQQQAQSDLKDERQSCKEQNDARDAVCKQLGGAPYDPVINPANFVGAITNPYFPLTPGTTFVYQGGGETIVTEVTKETKVILGVTCVVVRDRAYVGATWNSSTKEVQGGEKIEDTLDFYAQDVLGNVWYLGEIAQQFENGDLVRIDGSWRAGVNGAKPGIIMQAAPLVGDIYRQEFLLGEAEDLAQVISLGETVTGVFGGPYSDTVKTKDFSPIEPDAIENKIYAAGVGLVKEFDVSNPGQPLVLIDKFVIP